MADTKNSKKKSKKAQSKKAAKKSRKAASKKATKKSSEEKSSEDAGGGASRHAWWYLAGALLVIAGILVIGFISGGGSDRGCDEEYNNFCFIQQNDLWSFRVMVNGQPYRIAVHHLPEELEDIPVESNAVDTLDGLATMVNQTGNGRLFITMNPDAPSGVALGGVELAKVLGERYDIYDIPTRAALTKPPANVTKETPIVDCSDAGGDTFVIYLREHDRNYVGIPEGHSQCIVVQGTDADEVVKSADRLLYGLMGVMKG